ncbi:MAG: hypothetical protein ACK5SX_05735 [Sandaracinobacter sp.]
MLSVDTAQTTEPEAVDARLLIGILLRKWHWLFLGLIIGVFLVAAYLRVADYRYTSTLVVTAAETTAADSLAGRLGSIGGLAAAAGVNLGDGPGGNQFRLYVEALKSSATAERLARDQKLMRRLFPDEWNPATGRFEKPKGLVPTLVTGAKTVLGLPIYGYTPPNAARVKILLDKKLDVESNSRSPIVTIQFEHSDPAFATEFLSRVDKTVDGMLRERSLQRSDVYIAFLYDNLQRAAMTEQRSAIAQALVQQERIRMSASSDLPFAAQLFSGPAASFRPTSPKPPVLLAIGAFAGLAIALVAVFLRARRELMPNRAAD